MAARKQLVSKAELLTEVAVLRKELEIVNKQLESMANEKERLIVMVEGLQRALVAKESPMAYNDQRDAQLVETPEEEAARLKRQAVNDGVKNFIAIQESPLFEDANDMISSLVGVIGPPESSPVASEEG